MKTTRLVSDSPAATEAFAARVAADCSAGSVLAVHGPLGAGKSVFARGLARGLGIDAPVTSPTFALVQEYPCPDGRLFVHADMYRIEDPLELRGTGLEEQLFADATVVLVEWAERIEACLVPDRPGARLFHVTIEALGPQKRRIRLRGERRTDPPHDRPTRRRP